MNICRVFCALSFIASYFFYSESKSVYKRIITFSKGKKSYHGRNVSMLVRSVIDVDEEQVFRDLPLVDKFSKGNITGND